MNEEILDFNSLSRIKVAGNDEKIVNQDARKIFVAPKGGEYKRTSDFMLANDKKDLADTTYVSVEDFSKAIEETLLDNSEIKKIIMKKTGKKIKPAQLTKMIEEAKKAGKITLQNNAKIKNQTAKLVSVKTPNMTESAKVAGMMLGKEGPDLTNGDYVQQEELEFTVVKKEKIPVSVTPSKNKLGKTVKALSSVTVAVGLVALIPWIMHANSVTWHHVGPELQNVLHGINLGLGKVINASFLGKDSGLWQLANGNMMNADALESSLGIAAGTYGLTAAGIAKLTYDIKHGILKYMHLGKKEGAKDIEKNSELSGGKSL